MLRGGLWGEPFYASRSASWWRGELARWEVVDAGPIWIDLTFAPQRGRGELLIFQRKMTWPERIREGDWAVWKERPGRIAITDDSFSGPSILAGGPDAEPVLRALLNDPSPNVRRLARIGLKLPAE